MNIHALLCSALAGEDKLRPLYPCSRFIFDQSGKSFFFLPALGQKYFRFAGGKAEL
jgi:hypothetical protein